ncbi:NADH-quinone oxidoreductase subunit NuoH [bacterium]|nr:NADH-quinone oxidoreductase subunit NuoH [bacterium]MCI0603430.1 NADH-quinone oxidoreductase subunit NuoH [bacterium]
MLDQIFVKLKEMILHGAERFLSGSLLDLLSMLINMIAILLFAPLLMMYLTWLERKLVARIQDRWGPNRVGPWGLLQPIADGIKMILKEDITPSAADRVLHVMAPVLIVIPALMMFGVIPFGRNMVAVDLNIGIFFFISISALETMAVVMGGWSSRSKYSLLGGMRAAAQIVSYEVPLGLSLIPVIMFAGSLSTRMIAEAQGGWFGMHWYVLHPWGFLGFLIFMTTGIAEVNRTPFDTPEGESELVGGYHTEYSGMKFALFQMAEFLSAFAISAMAVTLFLGGWNGPVLPSWLWFMMKSMAVFFVLIWLRGTFPRFRIDQVMAFAWKFLLPLALANVFVAAIDYYIPGLLGYGLSWFFVLLCFFTVWAINSRQTAQHYGPGVSIPPLPGKAA